jgi:hypothetical protein
MVIIKSCSFLWNTKKPQQRTPLQTSQVVENNQKKWLIHTFWLCLPTTAI